MKKRCKNCGLYDVKESYCVAYKCHSAEVDVCSDWNADKRSLVIGVAVFSLLAIAGVVVMVLVL